MKSHLRQAKSCAWFLAAGKASADQPSTSSVRIEDGTAEDLEGLDDHGAETNANANADSDEDDGSDDDEDPAEAAREYEEEHDLFHFIAMADEARDIPGIGESGPGPSTEANRRAAQLLGSKRRILADEDDSRHIVEDRTAGTVIRMDETLHVRWARIFGAGVGEEVDETADVEMDGTGRSDGNKGNIYAPFASELDWRVAQWAVKDGIGHNSFDRLLAIPGVHIYIILFFLC